MACWSPLLQLPAHVGSAAEALSLHPSPRPASALLARALDGLQEGIHWAAPQTLASPAAVVLRLARLTPQLQDLACPPRPESTGKFRHGQYIILILVINMVALR